MGLKPAILVISLGVNLVLAAMVVRHSRVVPLPVNSAPQPNTEAAPTGHRAGPKQRPRAAQDESAGLRTSTPVFNWSQIESSDYTEYIARLRAFAVPERTIRDIVMADIRKLYQPRLAALRPAPSARTNFWEERGGYRPSRTSREQREQRRVLEKEQSELIKSLLGKDVYQEMARDAGSVDWFERSFGAIPEEQRDKVNEMHQRFQQMTSEIYAKADGYVDQTTQAELNAARRKFREELGSVLTPAQLEDYELRNSTIAQNMKYELRAFQPNEDEFRALFKYKQDLEDLASGRDDTRRPSSEEMKFYQQKLKEKEEALAQVLGPDRAKEFKLSEQYEFRNLFEAGVPKEAVFRVADMRQQVEAAAGKVRQDQSLSNEQRNAALLAIRVETEKTLAELLGERRARGYIGSGGHWLRSLAPRP